MDQLTQYISQHQNTIVKCTNALVIVVAIVLIAVNILKGMAAFSRGSIADGFKNVFYIAMILILAWVAVKGFFALIKKIAPDDNILPKGNDQFSNTAGVTTNGFSTSGEVLRQVFAGVTQY